MLFTEETTSRRPRRAKRTGANIAGVVARIARADGPLRGLGRAFLSLGYVYYEAVRPVEMLQAFHNLVTDERSEAPKTLGDLVVMRGVRKFPQRVKCAMLAWRAVEQALEQGTGEASISTKPA